MSSPGLTLYQPPGVFVRDATGQGGFVGVLELCGELVDDFELAFRGQDQGRQVLSDVGFEVTHV